MKTVVAGTAGQWREWLDAYRDSESEVWRPAAGTQVETSAAQHLRKLRHEGPHLIDLGRRRDELERRGTDRTGLPLENRRQGGGQYRTFIEHAEQAGPGRDVEHRDRVKGAARAPRRAGATLLREPRRRAVSPRWMSRSTD